MLLRLGTGLDGEGESWLAAPNPVVVSLSTIYYRAVRPEPVGHKRGVGSHGQAEQ